MSKERPVPGLSEYGQSINELTKCVMNIHRHTEISYTKSLKKIYGKSYRDHYSLLKFYEQIGEKVPKKIAGCLNKSIANALQTNHEKYFTLFIDLNINSIIAPLKKYKFLNIDESNDVMQEIFTSIAEKRDSLALSDNIKQNLHKLSSQIIENTSKIKYCDVKKIESKPVQFDTVPIEDRLFQLKFYNEFLKSIAASGLLKNIESFVIYSHYVKGDSLESIAKKLSLSRERIRQLKEIAKYKLKRNKHPDTPYRNELIDESMKPSAKK